MRSRSDREVAWDAHARAAKLEARVKTLEARLQLVEHVLSTAIQSLPARFPYYLGASRVEGMFEFAAAMDPPRAVDKSK